MTSHSPSYRQPLRKNLLKSAKYAEGVMQELRPHDFFNRASNDWPWPAHLVRRDGSAGAYAMHVLSRQRQSANKQPNPGLGYGLGDRDRDGVIVDMSFRNPTPSRGFLPESSFEYDEGVLHKRYWGGFEQISKKNGAASSVELHAPSVNKSRWPSSGMELRPAAVYSKQYKKWGERMLRLHHTDQSHPWSVPETVSTEEISETLDKISDKKKRLADIAG